MNDAAGYIANVPVWWHPTEQREQAKLAVAETLKILDPSKKIGQHPNGALLWGMPGVCKTSTACGILYAWGKADKSSRFEDFQGFAIRLRSSWKPAAKITQEQVFAELLEPEILCLDDIGKTDTTAEREALGTLFNLRINAGHPTLMTTNLAIDKVGIKAATEALDTRLLERMRGGIIQIQGDNARKEKKP